MKKILLLFVLKSLHCVLYKRKADKRKTEDEQRTNEFIMGDWRIY